MNKKIEQASWEENIETDHDLRNNIIIGLCWSAVIVFCAGVALMVNVMSI
jgi:hypothetical protein